MLIQRSAQETILKATIAGCLLFLERRCREALLPFTFEWQRIIATTFLALVVLAEVLDRAAFVAQRHRRSRIGKLYLHAGALFQIDLEVFARFVHCFNLRSHAYRRLAGDFELSVDWSSNVIATWPSSPDSDWIVRPLRS